MNIIIPLIIAILLYRIKLIDDRKLLNFEKFKKYLRRESITTEKNTIWEHETWLDKDIRFQLLGKYEETKNDEGKKQAILDYYKDYRDNEGTRIFIFWIIVINVSYLMFKSYYFHQVNFYSNISILICEIIFIILSIYSCLKSPQYTSFNNRILNVKNSKRIEKTYKSIQKYIEDDIKKLRKENNINYQKPDDRV